MSILCFWTAIYDFQFPIASHTIGNSFLEIVGVVYRLRYEFFLFVEPPSCYFYFRLHHTVWGKASLNSSTSETCVLLLELCSYVVSMLSYKFSIFERRHLGFLTSARTTQNRLLLHWFIEHRKCGHNRRNFSTTLHTIRVMESILWYFILYVIHKYGCKKSFWLVKFVFNFAPDHRN